VSVEAAEVPLAVVTVTVAVEPDTTCHTLPGPVAGVTCQPGGADRLSATRLTAPGPLLASVVVTVVVAPCVLTRLEEGLIVS
jgi:hypothetical protein